jgi:hypothetical protein
MKLVFPCEVTWSDVERTTLSDTLEVCQHFFQVFPKFSPKRFKPRHGFETRSFPNSLAAALVALPSSCSHQLDSRIIQRSVVNWWQFSFSRKCNGVVTIWHALSTGQVRPGGEYAKNQKNTRSAPLPVPGYFWPMKHTNDTK